MALLITDKMIERAAKVIALQLHIVNDLSLPIKVEFGEPLYCIYFPTYDYVINFTKQDLLMCMDDFCDKILLPAIKKLLTDEQRFIHEDCS